MSQRTDPPEGLALSSRRSDLERSDLELSDDHELSDEVLEWLAGGSHGCPACPHVEVGPFVGASGQHVLVDGSVLEGGKLIRKLGGG